MSERNANFCIFTASLNGNDVTNRVMFHDMNVITYDFYNEYAESYVRYTDLVGYLVIDMQIMRFHAGQKFKLELAWQGYFLDSDYFESFSENYHYSKHNDLQFKRFVFYEEPRDTSDMTKLQLNTYKLSLDVSKYFKGVVK